MLKEIAITSFLNGEKELNYFYEIIIFNCEDIQEFKKILDHLNIEYFENSHQNKFLIEGEILEPFLIKGFEEMNLEKIYCENWRLNDKQQYIKMLNFYIYEQ